MEERKEIDIPAIFEKIKELDNEKIMQLKRAANVSFENLQTTQRITFFNLLDDDSMGKAKSEFLIHMMSMFVKQDCQTGKPFEKLLAEMYNAGSASVKQKIGYMIDEQDRYVLFDYIYRYAKIFSKDHSIDIVKLTSDILNWSYSVKNDWIKVIAGIS